MGLGLTISKLILQQLYGDIKVSSKAGVGSNFSFLIPIESFLQQEEVPSIELDLGHVNDEASTNPFNLNREQPPS